MIKRCSVLLIFSFLMLVSCAPASVPEVAAPVPTQEREFVLETILPKDAIPALDHPTAVSAEEATLSLQKLVIGVEVGGEARAYPVGLMSRYEITNDTLGGEPIAVLFCPLCNVAAVTSREVTDVSGELQTLTFGMSGQLMEKAFVMYDHETSSLWALSRLQAIGGALEGESLELVQANQMSWEEWVTQYPETTVVVDELTLATSSEAAFEMPVLPGLESESASEEVVLEGYVIGVASASEALAFPLEQLETAGVINGELADLPPFLLTTLEAPGEVRAWERSVKGQVLTFTQTDNQLQDQETGSEWDPETGVALAGALEGEQLVHFPTLLTHWLGWKDLYETTQVWKP